MEKRRIKRNGNSLCVILDRRTLKNVYDLGENDEVFVDYDFPEIIINVPKARDRAQERFQKKNDWLSKPNLEKIDQL